jgi:GH15 family glucan-1,4-alpha-glucosidase
MANKLTQSYDILNKLRLPNNMYVASTSSDYNFTWLRDTFYEVLPFLNKSCDKYETTYHAILDILRKYEFKLDIHSKQKPHYTFEYIHPRYTKDTLEEVQQEWGNCQHDATGAILFGIGAGIKAGKHIIRDKKDHEIIQKLVDYLGCCHYYIDCDNSIWEENREIHSNSLAACIAGLQAVREVVFVPRELIKKGYDTLSNMFPLESTDHPVDLAQLSMIYPYRVIFGEDAKLIVDRVESILLRKRGVIRYETDSYYSTLESEHGRHKHPEFYKGSEAEWTFGLPWLALCHIELGNISKAEEYIKRTEEVMLEDGSLPELYFANSDKYNGNTPLGWSNAMFVLAKERYLEISSDVI